MFGTTGNAARLLRLALNTGRTRSVRVMQPVFFVVVQMYRSCLYHLVPCTRRYELGMTTPLHRVPFHTYSLLGTNSVIKSTWCFLHENNVELRHDINIPPQRIHDQVLMEVFREKAVGQDELLSINQCGLFLCTFHLSNIVDGSML